MPAEVCFNMNGRRICIPLYVEVERRFGPEPDPRLVGGIDLGELIQPDDGRITAGWIEAIGLDRRQQRQLAAMVQIADAATALPEDLRGGVVAIGNFDGVHRGHQAVLSAAAEIATRERLPLVCLTFEPHPRSVFRPEQPVARLTPAPLKARILDELGFDAVVEQAFTREFASETAESFIEDCLLGALGGREQVEDVLLVEVLIRQSLVGDRRGAGR